MAVTLRKNKFLFGLQPPPPLPHGWTVQQGKLEWAIAKSPTGEEYLISPSERLLYPWKGWGDNGIKPGKHYVDTASPIPIP